MNLKLIGNSLARVLVLILSTSAAYASVDSVPGDPLESFKDQPNYSQSLLPGIELYHRAQFVFSHFHLKAEESSENFVKDLNDAQNAIGQKAILKYLDPHEQWMRFLLPGSRSAEAFLDRDSKQERDFSISLAQTHLKSVNGLNAKLSQIAKQWGTPRPLAGLKVALDPGHMGGDIWDKMTGKYVTDSQGHLLSEGVINVETALLLEEKLRALGAETLVTHRGFTPVTSQHYSDLDIGAYGRAELRGVSLAPWFQTLLATAPAGNTLAQSFDQSEKVTTLFSESMRSTYFVLRADLDARAQAIAEFNPDITLIIHYDADVTAQNPHGVNPAGRDAVKTYVVGAFAPEEFATEQARAEFAKHLYEPESWNASLSLSRQIASHMHRELDIAQEKTSAGDVVEIEPGVLARNLALTRRAYSHAVSYVECLYYNNPLEFRALEKADHSMLIDGKEYPYSNRLESVSHALKNSIIDFIKTYAVPKNPSHS